MPNALNFRSGQVSLQKFRVETDTVIAAGDLVYLDGTVIRPASDLPWNTDLATTQQDFADLFAGVAHEPSADGETDPISVDVSAGSIYEFDVTSGTFDNGSLLAPEEGSSDLLNQQLAAVGAAAQAIARASEFKDAAVTQLRVTFASAFTTSSTNANAAIG